MSSAVNESAERLSIGQCATLACLLEVNAPKPGNVHRAADFDDATLNDFAASAVAIGPVMQRATQVGVGETVLQCIHATRRVTSTNTNLGAVLLLAPLARVPRDREIRTGIRDVLAALSPSDSQSVYQAINLANPGGLGEADEFDVRSSPPESLLRAMQAASARDQVATEYASGFDCVLSKVAPYIIAAINGGSPLPRAIVHTQVQLLAAFGDSLIARKCGEQVNDQCVARASRVLASGAPDDDNYLAALSDFDFWLRSDGRRRNPGTTADLIAAGLFVCLRDELISPPFG
jgi:triphosphoribosyl-dephospho-CoA synthase